MKKVEQWGYLAPEIEVSEIVIERGFELSSNVEQIEEERNPIGWN